MRAIAAAALVALCVRPAAGQAQEQEEYVPDLGVHTISDAEHMVTLPAASREHLNRALVWQYGFNQPEAQKEARQAIDSASGVCALCHTVKAYTLGPFLNKPMMSQAEASLAHEETQQSLELLDAAPGSPSAKERGVIEAFALRHASADAASLTTEGHVAATQAFYGAMCELASTLDDDADVWTWCAEGLMAVQRYRRLPYAYYTDAEGTPTPETTQAAAALNRAMALSHNSHPLALHLWVHLTEPSPVDDSPAGATGAGRADAAADALEGLVPGSGHLQHMPGHTYSREGRWADVAWANLGTDYSVGTHREADGAHTADELAVMHGLFAYGAAHNAFAGVDGAATDGQLSLALLGASDLRRMWTEEPSCGTQGGPGAPEILFPVLARFSHREKERSFAKTGFGQR
jgi:hypothetical protein